MIDLTSLDFDLTEAIRSEVKAIEVVLGRHMPNDSKIHVTLSKSAPDVFHVHMQGHYLGNDIISDHESHNFHKALEYCKDHFVKQVDKRRVKVNKGYRNG